MNFVADPVGDTGIRISFQHKVTPKLVHLIQFYSKQIMGMEIKGVSELVPAFNSITIYYKPHIITYKQLLNKLTPIQDIPVPECDAVVRRITIPVVYGGEYGPDLKRVAYKNDLTESKVIELHQKPEYLVYMLGFLPGFPYLGGLDKRLATPRLDEPRLHTPPQSVGIAHEQTGIYPLESPGGWNIIGKTPVTLFDMNKKGKEFLFRAGDLVNFEEITLKELSLIEEQLVNGEYKLKIKEGYHEKIY